MMLNPRVYKGIAYIHWDEFIKHYPETGKNRNAPRPIKILMDENIEIKGILYQDYLNWIRNDLKIAAK